MLAEQSPTDRPGGDTRGRLRAATLRLGALLGWQAHEVEAFAEALTGRPWRECGRADLARVFDEYHEVALAIAARMGRRGARRRREEAHADRD